MSKALGGHGGIIFGEDDLIETLKKTSVLTNSCSNVTIPAAAATAKALEILYHNPGLRRKLWDNVTYAKNGLRNLGFDLNDSPVPIICLHDQGKRPIDFKTLQRELFERNIAVTHVPEGAYSSVPRGGALRISVFSTHSRDQIDHLSEEIKRLV